MKNIGVIGLGEMGFPMAVNLQKAGFQVFAFDINKKIYPSLEKQGIVCCDSAKDVAQKTDKYIMSIVRDTKQTENVIFGDESIITSGRLDLTVILMSTIGINSIELLEERAKKSNIELVDAPISGAKSGAENATLTVMFAGKETLYKQCLPYFNAIGKNVYYFGAKVGAGQVAKLANNMILAINMVGVAEGLMFAKKYTLPSDELISMLKVSTGNSWVVQNWDVVAKWWENYQPNTTLDIVFKDLSVVINECQGEQISLQLGALTLNLLKDAWQK